MPMTAAPDRRFEIALSFPGKHRDYVKQVADLLAARFSREQVLYDHYHKAEFARPGLSVYLPGLYRKNAELIVIFLCPQYAEKLWCQLEWRHIHELISTVEARRIMFLSFGNPGDLSELGILGGDGYIDLTHETPGQVTEEILRRWSLERGVALPTARSTNAVSAATIVHPQTLPVSTRPKWASAEGQDEYGRWAEISIQGVVQRLRWIEPGEFLMGVTSAETLLINENWQKRELPQHKVTLSRGYWLADTACTQALWHAVMGSNPSQFKDDPQNPVEQVSWDDVQEFLGKLQSKMPECQLSLPTEAQWEYACRAGTQTPFFFGRTINTDQVNCNGDIPYGKGKRGEYRQKTVPVKALPANAWGLYQMHGNVWEWCRDDLRTYESQAIADPLGPEGQADDALRVARGGSWGSFAQFARSAFRYQWPRVYRVDYLGFRFSLEVHK